MPAAPHYFGSAERRRFAFLHLPNGPATGAVVICPPIAYEQVCAYRTLRLLAERLAAGGLVTLRLDYDGTGNSVGSADDPHRVAAWRGSIDDAVAEARSFGFERVTLVGLRIGGTLAAAVASGRPDVESIVLWDPVESGRRHARTLRLMSSSATGSAESPGIAVAGIPFSEETLADLAALAFEPAAAGVPTLIVRRAEDGADAKGGPPGWPAQVEVLALTGTSALLDGDAERARVPAEIVDIVARWVVAHHPDAVSPPPHVPAPRSVAAEQTPAGVIEHAAIRVGPAGLFAVQTVDPAAAPTRAVVMLNNGVASHVGPGRAWVDFAARCAEQGWLALRVDLAGLGDSPARPGRPENDSYPASAAADLREATEHLAAIGVERVAVLGLCSGALLGFDGAFAVPQIDLLVGINGRFDKPFFGESRRDMRARAAGRTLRLFAVPLTKAPLFPMFDGVPTWIWRLLAGLGLVASPTRIIESVLSRGAIRVVMIFGTDEWGLKALRRRGGRRFERILHDPAVTLVEVPGLDHSMFDAGARARVLSKLLDILRESDRQGAFR